MKEMEVVIPVLERGRKEPAEAKGILEASSRGRVKGKARVASRRESDLAVRHAHPMARPFAMATTISPYAAGREDADLCMFVEDALANTPSMLASRVTRLRPKGEATAPSD
jgi:hypothetical protein